MLAINDYKNWALIAGFKTGGVKSVTERLGGSEYRQFHRGGSDHVNV